MQTVVDQFNLSKWFGQEEARIKLVQAGYRGNAPYITFLFLRMISPVVCLAAAAFYLFVVLNLNQPTSIKLGICIAAAYVGMHLPLMLLKNKIQRRQLSIKRAFPDSARLAADLRRIRHVDRGRFPAASAMRSARSRWRWRKNSRSPWRNCPICRSAGRPMRIWPSAPTSTA